MQSLDTILSYHAHIYFEGDEQRLAAQALREDIAARFSVVIGRWHDRLIGPHARAMYQVAFAPSEFSRFVPWLMLNRRGLAILIHPNTGHPRADHLVHAMWLGEILNIVNADRLPERDDPAPEGARDTDPKVTS